MPEPLFEEFGDGIKVTMFRKVSSTAEKVTDGEQKVSNTYYECNEGCKGYKKGLDNIPD